MPHTPVLRVGILVLDPSTFNSSASFSSLLAAGAHMRGLVCGDLAFLSIHPRFLLRLLFLSLLISGNPRESAAGLLPFLLLASLCPLRSDLCALCVKSFSCFLRIKVDKK